NDNLYAREDHFLSLLDALYRHDHAMLHHLADDALALVIEGRRENRVLDVLLREDARIVLLRTGVGEDVEMHEDLTLAHEAHDGGGGADHFRVGGESAAHDLSHVDGVFPLGLIVAARLVEMALFADDFDAAREAGDGDHRQAERERELRPFRGDGG